MEEVNYCSHYFCAALPKCAAKSPWQDPFNTVHDVSIACIEHAIVRVASKTSIKWAYWIDYPRQLFMVIHCPSCHEHTAKPCACCNVVRHFWMASSCPSFDRTFLRGATGRVYFMAWKRLQGTGRRDSSSNYRRKEIWGSAVTIGGLHFYQYQTKF